MKFPLKRILAVAALVSTSVNTASAQVPPPPCGQFGVFGSSYTTDWFAAFTTPTQQVIQQQDCIAGTTGPMSAAYCGCIDNGGAGIGIQGSQSASFFHIAPGLGNARLSADLCAGATAFAAANPGGFASAEGLGVARLNSTLLPPAGVVASAFASATADATGSSMPVVSQNANFQQVIVGPIVAQANFVSYSVRTEGSASVGCDGGFANAGGGARILSAIVLN